MTRVRLVASREPRAIQLGNGVAIVCRPCSSIDIAAANAKAQRTVARVLAALEEAEIWGSDALALEIDPDRVAALGRVATAVELAVMIGTEWNLDAPFEREAVRDAMIGGGASEIFLDGALMHAPFRVEPAEGNVYGAAPSGDGDAAPTDAPTAAAEASSADPSSPTPGMTTMGVQNL
jgi:hypothetical protein